MKLEVLKKITTVVVIFFAISGAEIKAGAYESETLFSLLREGDRSIRFDDNYKNLILLIGNAGAGKTTVGLLLTANQSDLEAYYDDHADKILIRDNGRRIATDVVKSKTMFPELMVNPDNAAAFYDCPGFRDTRKRHAVIDLANTIFIKKIAEHAQTIKVVMIVNYYSVRNGGSREDFLNLLQSTLKLLKPIEKFVNSTALIATKVSFVKSPKRTILTVANFLNDFKESLPDVLPNENDVRRAQILIDALTVTENGNYSKIYFTRAPPQEGLLSDLPDMQSDRLGIGKVIYEHIEYVPVSPADFGYTFSPETETLIVRMLYKLESNAAAHLQFLSSVHQQHFQSLVSSNFTLTDLVPAVANAKSNLKQALEGVKINPNVSSSSFVEIFMDSMTNATISIGPQASKIIAAINDDKKVFALLKRVANLLPKVPQLLVGPIQRSVDFLQVLQDWLMLLNEIDSKLNHLSGPTTAEPKMNETDSEAKEQLVKDSSWFVILERFVRHCNLEIAFTQDQVIQAVNESIAIAHMNLIVRRVIEARWAHVGLMLKKLASDLGQHLVNEEYPHARQQLQIMQQVLVEKIDYCESYGMITPAEIGKELNSSMMVTFGGVLPVARTSLESLKNDQKVLNLFDGFIANKSIKIGACALYQNFETLKQLSTEILAWFEHVDKIAAIVAINITTHEVQGPLIVTAENSNSILTQISNRLILKEPINLEIPAHVKALQFHLNHMLLQMCADSSAKVSKAFDSAVGAAKENLGFRSSNMSSAQAFVTELIQLKSNFSNLIEDVVTCSGARNLQTFLNKQFGAEVSNEDGCELVELVRSNVPGFCMQNSKAMLSPLTAIEALLESTIAWYEFLLALAYKLDSYPMQRDKHLYNVADVTNWGQRGMPQGINVTPENCEAFVERASGTIGTTHGRKAQAICTTVSQLMMTQLNGKSPLDQLNHVLTLALKTLPKCYFDAGIATVKGPYVKTSEALQFIRPGSTGRLVVLATHGFFIDTDVIALESNGGKPFDLIVISPDWTAAITRTITFNGHNTEEWPPAKIGETGNPGKPGEHRGNLFRLAQNLNSDSVGVSTNGGNAGAGQQGGGAQPGNDGYFCDDRCRIYFRGDTHGDRKGRSLVYVNSRYGRRQFKIGPTQKFGELDGAGGGPRGPNEDVGKDRLAAVRMAWMEQEAKKD